MPGSDTRNAGAHAHVEGGRGANGQWNIKKRRRCGSAWCAPKIIESGSKDRVVDCGTYLDDG